MKTSIAVERLRELLSYDAETGIFTWKVRRRGQVNPGDVAGTVRPCGRIEICIDCIDYKAHRLAWLYMTGSWPVQEIDHRDTNASNNRWINLREADSSTNKENHRRARVDNKTGLLGVFKHSQYDAFVAQISVKGKRIHLGCFKTPELAHAAYVSAKREFHKGNTL